MKHIKLYEQFVNESLTYNDVQQYLKKIDPKLTDLFNVLTTLMTWSGSNTVGGYDQEQMTSTIKNVKMLKKYFKVNDIPKVLYRVTSEERDFRFKPGFIIDSPVFNSGPGWSSGLHVMNTKDDSQIAIKIINPEKCLGVSYKELIKLLEILKKNMGQEYKKWFSGSTMEYFKDDKECYILNGTKLEIISISNDNILTCKAI